MTVTMMTSQPDRASPALVVDDLAVGYGGSDVLREVSLTVTDGSITCVVGPNGAGKSTLLATISGLLRPSAGSIELDGTPISGLTPREILGRGLAQIPQAHSLFAEMTVRENVEMGAFTIDDHALVAERLRAVEELYPIVSERAGEKAGSL